MILSRILIQPGVYFSSCLAVLNSLKKFIPMFEENLNM